MRVFLIHGMGRTPASMWVLDRRLRAAGYLPSLFGYFVTVSDLDVIAARFLRHVERVREADAAQHDDGGYAVVSHSLGGIITRLAAPRLPPGWRAFTMLAPPNRPPAVVTGVLGELKLFRLFTRDAGRKLKDPAFYRGLPKPSVPTLVIAGTGGPRLARLHLDAPNDGLLRAEETLLEDTEHVEVDAMHTFLMNRTDVLDTMRAFFSRHGFEPAAAEQAPPTRPAW